MKDKVEQKKFYYPNGKLWSERCYKQGVPHGRHREWHENGVLASEMYLKDGVPDGIGRQWDENGDLIAEYEIKNGTGIQKAWMANQGVWCEFSWVNGSMSGRQRIYWINDGTVVVDTFWIKNKKVSKKRYMDACKVDPSLPRYDEQSVKKEKSKKSDRSKIANQAGRERKDYIGDDFLVKLLETKETYEAFSWLTESNMPERSLGEAQGQESSIALVKSLYELGAKCIWVFDIDGDPTEEQNSGRLIVELPEDQRQRAKILDKCTEIGADQGFAAEPDTVQRYTLLMLD